MAVKYLITGATGGLGQSILDTLLASIPASQIAASSTRPSAAAAFEKRGVQFRLIDFESPDTLNKAFADVENLFFVSTSEIDNKIRCQQHRNVVAAAKTSGIKHVYYSSLALGGFEDAWDVELQVAHLETEKLLKESGLTWTSVREGIYADAFPCFVNWFPTNPNQTLYLPADGQIAYALRSELGEATAKLMLAGGHANEIVLLTGPRTNSMADMVAVVNEVTSRNVTIEWVSDEEYIAKNSANDEGGKPEAFFRVWSSVLHGLQKGAAATASPLMGELLGREPLDGKSAARKLLEGNRDYTWHQNYAPVPKERSEERKDSLHEVQVV
ncbi:NAD(P)-binding protein [Saccharata proteae CBS 121410]|uniref:NAD(P)-binding protein n=1 Tax=Saccharata proteae CBS 121410 TaxID=1314787 RepID=A0A9P4HU20_9PEZI|nr:NAD(P)-binding protein [Saccharata proteae CBS 121410]